MRKALIVGIDHYPGNQLYGCVNDAKKIAELLENHEGGKPNFIEPNVILSSQTTITRGSLKTELKELFAYKSDIALFYFSGHGILNVFGGQIVTPDYKENDEGVSMDVILKLANDSPADNKIIILDCCNSGAMGSPEAIGGELSGLAEGVTVLVACGKKQVSIEQSGKGVFTSLLIDALRGGSADLVGHVSPGSIYAFIDRALGPWWPRPIFKTNVSNFVSLRDAISPIKPQILRKITKYFKAATDEYALNPSFEFTEESAIPKNVEIFQDLQKMHSVGLVKPVGEKFMYFAAKNSKSCELTSMGYQYWTLVNTNKI